MNVWEIGCLGQLVIIPCGIFICYFYILKNQLLNIYGKCQSFFMKCRFHEEATVSGFVGDHFDWLSLDFHYGFVVLFKSINRNEIYIEKLVGSEKLLNTERAMFWWACQWVLMMVKWTQIKSDLLRQSQRNLKSPKLRASDISSVWRNLPETHPKVPNCERAMFLGVFR